MLLSKISVESEVRLILMIRLRRRPHKVIRAGDIRQRVVLKNLDAERVQTIWPNRVIRKGRARRSGRIENRLSKNALPLRECRNHAETRDARKQPRPLPVGEEECP